MAATIKPLTFVPLGSLVAGLAGRARTRFGDSPGPRALEVALAAAAPAAGNGRAASAADAVGFTQLSQHADAERMVVRGELAVLPGQAPGLPLPGLPWAVLVARRLGPALLEVRADSARLEVHRPLVTLRFDPACLRPASGEGFAEIDLVELDCLVVDSREGVHLSAAPGARVRLLPAGDPWVVGRTGLALLPGEPVALLHEGPEGGPAVFFPEAALRLPALTAPDGEPLALPAAGARVDPAGFSATASLRHPGLRPASLHGFRVDLAAVDVVLRGGAAVRATAAGALHLPGTGEVAACLVGLGGGEPRLLWLGEGEGRLRVDRADLERLDGQAYLLLRGELDGRPASLRASPDGQAVPVQVPPGPPPAPPAGPAPAPLPPPPSPAAASPSAAAGEGAAAPEPLQAALTHPLLAGTGPLRFRLGEQRAEVALPWPLPPPAPALEPRQAPPAPPPYPELLRPDPPAGPGEVALSPGEVTEGVPLDTALVIGFAHPPAAAPDRFPRLLGLAERAFHEPAPGYAYRYDLAELCLERLGEGGGVAERHSAEAPEPGLYGSWRPGGGGTGALVLLGSAPPPPAGGDPVPERPPRPRELDLYRALTAARGGGETADGEPDPSVPGRTVTADGVTITVRGQPEARVRADGGVELAEPGAGPFEVDVRFPREVVLLELPAVPDGEVRATRAGGPAEPLPRARPAPPPAALPPPPPPSPRRGRWLRGAVPPLATLVALEVAMAYALGRFEPWLARGPWPTLALLAALPLLPTLAWWYARRERRPRAARPRVAWGRRRARPPRADGAVPGAAEPASGELVADRVRVTTTRLAAGRLRWVDAEERRGYEQAVETNRLRAASRERGARPAGDAGTAAEPLLLRPGATYRVRVALTKSGRPGQEERESHELVLRTQPGPPADLGPYVEPPPPEELELPLFRAEAVGVRFRVPWVRRLYEEAAGAQLALELRDPTGAALTGRVTEWREAPGTPPGSALVAAPTGTGREGWLAPGVTYEALVRASGPGAPAEPLYRFQVRAGRYHDLAAWLAALPRQVGQVTVPHLPEDLWAAGAAGPEPLQVGEPWLLPLLTTPLPATPLLRRVRSDRPVLLLTLPEPVPWRRLDLLLTPPGGTPVPLLARWLADGTRAFLTTAGPAEPRAAGAWRLEARYRPLVWGRHGGPEVATAARDLELGSPW